MVYVEPGQMGWRPLRDSWMASQLPSALTEAHRSHVRSLCFHIALNTDACMMNGLSLTRWLSNYIQVSPGMKHFRAVKEATCERQTVAQGSSVQCLMQDNHVWNHVEHSHSACADTISVSEQMVPALPLSPV